eukprot:CAMPEP_0168609276 /NCGR_PEP_ID=MMETSP0449_2-20121227/1111_1 /TAXON_ID=1082188 /ORGANISM="Strombidium rassoulzadegani, Strain ras09" /LENGTH=158 /DNA_ID=CAMNT_0008649391 /DNA_START=34 /DNA_END=510 /DNA_ORIENTATION=+
MDNFKCIQFAVSEDCEGAALDFTNTPQAMKTFVEEVNMVAQALLTVGAKMVATDLEEYLARGLNSLKCVGSSAFDNLANLVLSFYYLLKQFEQEAFIPDTMQMFYPNLCTCLAEIDYFGYLLAGNQKGEGEYDGSIYIGVCSEAAQEDQNNSSSSSSA